MKARTPKNDTGAGAATGVQLELKPQVFEIPAHVENWDEYFLHIAWAVSIKSKDPRCSVGAVVVSKDNVLLSTGFNGFARGVHDVLERLENVEEKLKLVCHAENNAILNAARVGVSLEGATIYVNKFPCLACCNAIIQAGIKRIYTHDDRYWGDDPLDQEQTRKKEILHEARITVDAPFHPDFKPNEPIDPRKRLVPTRDVSSTAQAFAKKRI